MSGNTRATKAIKVVNNSVGGKALDENSRADGRAVVWDENGNMYIHLDPLEAGDITFEALNTNGDIGEGADQVARGDHDHEIGDVTLLFENSLI